MFDRLAGTWTYWGWKGGYFYSEADAQAFFDEHRYMLAMQMVAPNSPQWFNTGLHWAYGIDGPSQGHFYVDYKTGKLEQSETAYEHPQPHACFIQSIADDLVNEGGIMDLWVREARLFKYGSGTGSNFSKLRGENEKLSGGGTLVRPDELPQDRRPRRRRHQVGRHHAPRRQDGDRRCRPSRHRAVHRLEGDRGAEGRQPRHRLQDQPEAPARILKACVNCEGSGDDCFDAEKNPVLRREIKAARRNHVPDNYIRRVIQFAKQGYKDIDFPIYDTDWDSEAYLTVSGQNSNNTVRVTDEFLKAVEADRDWDLFWRTKPGKIAKTLKARELWEKIGYAAWASADPGLQFHTTINDWHTCAASGPIIASNPCSEYMFLDDTACNLASLNLLAFHTPAAPPRRPAKSSERLYDVEGYEHAVRLWTIVLEISVLMAQFPSKEIAQRSYDFRTLGLGYANVGGLLMSSGIPYDSDAGRAHLRRAVGDHDRRQLRHLRRNGGRARPVPALRREPRRDAARDAQPSPRRLRRAHRLRADDHAAGAARPQGQSRPEARRARQARLGPRARARRGARLPQCAGDRGGADRHHRPGDGLRHHRHRARLRAGEIQEARRRRLLQDHQPRRARGAARARLQRERRSPRSKLTRVGHGSLGQAPGDQSRHAQGQGL